MIISDWTVDYGDGPQSVTIPHAWRQDVPVTWEGPAIYRTTIARPNPGSKWIRFEGISYAASVWVNGEEVGAHEGMWDAFEFELPDADRWEIEVRVTKNGGATYPVREVASGFIPFVYHTFGGIYKPVRLVEVPMTSTKPTARVAWAEGSQVWIADRSMPGKSIQDAANDWLRKRRGEEVDDSPAQQGARPFYARGVLTWGWYPELGHHNPDEATIRREIAQAQRLGFNLIKFCLWVPPHRYLELLHDAGLFAWIELPLWDPTSDSVAQRRMADELERIVEQYRHHPNVVFWTIGCELHETTTARYRQELTERVREALMTPDGPSALVKDNSGSAEMYGGDLREYGDFYDFHPYCETPLYPEVLDSLMPGPRPAMPVLLGEFNDIDVHRDLARIRVEEPYWISLDPALNDKGVRWQHDLPGVVPVNRFAVEPEANRSAALMASSKGKAIFIRKFVQEQVRARSDIAGYVVTGWRDTPISSAGMIDDWDEVRYAPEDLAHWNRETCLFPILVRRPPWVRGGNRPGWRDPFNHFAGRIFWRIGAHAESEVEGALEWDVLNYTWEGDRRPVGRVAFGTDEALTVRSGSSIEVGQISVDVERSGGFLLRARFGGAENTWPLWVVPPYDPAEFADWKLDDPRNVFEDLAIGGDHGLWTTRLGASAERGIVFLLDEGTKPMPFWREAAYEFLNDRFWEPTGLRDAWARWLPMTPDCVLDMEQISRSYPGWEFETLLNRIDVRTYAEHPVLVRAQKGAAEMLITTLRPYGGLGIGPRGVTKNPSGVEFLRHCIRIFTRTS